MFKDVHVCWPGFKRMEFEKYYARCIYATPQASKLIKMHSNHPHYWKGLIDQGEWRKRVSVN